MRRVASRRTSTSSGTTMSSTTSGPRPSTIRSSAVACTTVRGNPSSTNPQRASLAVEPLLDDPDHHVVADEVARPPSSSFAATAELGAGLHRLAQDVAGRDLRQPPRAREPLRLRALARPGRPEHHDVQRRQAPSRRRTLLAPPPADPRLLHEAVVVPHDELRLDLLHGVHRHADDDQQRRAAEVERARPCPR